MELRQEYQQKQNIFQGFVSKFVAWLRVVTESRMYGIEAQNAIAAIVWGCVLINPNWHTFASSPSYGAMAQLSDEANWGVMMASIGMLNLIFSIYQVRFFQRITILSLACIWAFIGTMLGVSNIQGTGPYTYGVIALFALLSFWRISYEMR